MAFWRLPGAISGSGAENAPERPSGGFLGPFRAQGLKMLQNGFLKASWAYLWRGFGNAPKWSSGGFLYPFCGLGLEYFKITFWRLAEPILRPGLGNAPKMVFWRFIKIKIKIKIEE